MSSLTQPRKCTSNDLDGVGRCQLRTVLKLRLHYDMLRLLIMDEGLV